MQRRNLQKKRKKEEKKIPPLVLFIGSWNVGNSAPPEDLSAWIPKEKKFDIVAIGAQECKYDSKSKLPAEKDWVQTIQKNLGEGYHLLQECHLWQIRLVIFVAQSHLPSIHNVESSTEATGIASVMGNKGGTVIAFTINDLSLCFVNAHLAAHQSKLEKRNHDVAEVIGNIKLGFKKQQMDILNQYHHVFWCGDLNYRVDYGDQGDKETPSKEQFDEMVKKIKKKNYKKLQERDQLNHAMKNSLVFLDFQEGFPMKFPPTFKVKKGAESGYEEKRSPAWCDRILWRSFEGHAITQTSYDYAPKITTSDHKPVLATFDLARFDYRAGWDPELGPCLLKFKGLSGEGLPAGDINGFSDPFIEFYSPFIVGNRVCTNVIKKTLNPKWEEKELQPLALTINRKERLEDTVIFVRVFDYDVGSPADLLCSGVLSLRHALKGTETKFALNLTKSGLPKGKLIGTIQLTWGSTATRTPKPQTHAFAPQPSVTSYSLSPTS